MKLYSISHTKEKIIVEKTLPKRNELYYAFEYEKGKKKLMQVGVECDSATSVLVKQKDITISLVKSKNGIWYHASSTWKASLYDERTEGIFGLNVGGDFFIQCWNDNELIDEAHVAIIPQVFSLHEYRSMQQEVIQLIESFSLDLVKNPQNEEIYLKRVQRYLYPLSEFEQIVNQFVVILDEIIDSPAFKLDEELVKRHKQNIKRWSPQLIIEASVTQKEYFTTTQRVQSFNIVEHQMIRTMIMEFLNRMNVEREKEQLYINQLNKDLDNLQITLNNINVTQKNILEGLKIQIEHDLRILIYRKERLDALFANISVYLETPLFNREAKPVEETHLFKMDVKYNEVFELYIKFKEIRKELQAGLQLFIKSLLKSPTLYEVWILLKMVEQLKQWSFDSKIFIDWLQNKYFNIELLEGFDEIFELPNMPFRVRIMFNVYLKNIDMKPDYLIGIQQKNNGRWQWHTADAKYKIFNEKQIRELQDSINRSAIRYKNNIIIEGVPITSSVIIHPNLNVVHWNLKFDGGQPHSFSQFYVKPSDTSLLRVYFKRLLHHFGKFENICPTCNTVTSGSPKTSNPNILTYVCSSCSEVWVSSHCWSCGEQKGTLFKYAIDNYNFQVEKQWNVHCPRCYADANAHYSQDASVLKEGYVFKSKRKKIVRRYEYKEIPCPRCGGSGRLPEFRHIQNGQCFLCFGNCTIKDKVMVEVEVDYDNFSEFNNTLGYVGKSNEVNQNNLVNRMITLDDLPF